MRTRLVLIIGAMLLGFACAGTPPPTPPSVDVSGTWVGTWAAFQGTGGAGQMRGQFRQDGATVYGNFEINNPGVDPPVSRTYVNGRIFGNQLHLYAPSEGLLVVEGEEMTGNIQTIVLATIKLRKQP